MRNVEGRRVGLSGVDARTPLRPFVQLSAWPRLALAGAASGVLAIVAYVALAGFTPGLALLLSTAAAFFALLAAVLRRWPVEHKITVNRQAEVVGYRLGLTLLIHYGVGLAVLWGLNGISPEQVRVPIAWDAPFTRPWQAAFLRRVSFWPFYALVLVGCHLPFPTPPGAC